MEFRKSCPYCGDNRPKRLLHTEPIRYERDRAFFVEVHLCTNCNKPIFLLLQPGQFAPELVEYLPTPQHTEYPDYPQNVRDLSPEGFDIYVQAMRAKECNWIDLMVAGIRMALERIVWNYLFYIKEIDPQQVENNLCARIEAMELDAYTDDCATVVRLWGNDYIHIQKKLDFTIEDALYVFHEFCKSIDQAIKKKFHFVIIDEMLPEQQTYSARQKRAKEKKANKAKSKETLTTSQPTSESSDAPYSINTAARDGSEENTTIDPEIKNKIVDKINEPEKSPEQDSEADDQ